MGRRRKKLKYNVKLMREKIINSKVTGILELDDIKLENVVCEYSYDKYSNKIMKGIFDVIGIPIKLMNNFDKYEKFIFSNKNITIKGSINGLMFGLNNQLNFEMSKVNEVFSYSNSIPSLMEVYFEIPYVSTFARRITKGNGNDFLYKFRSDPIKFNICEIEIEFFNEVKLEEYNPPDKIFNRIISPLIKCQIGNNENIMDKLNYFGDIMDDVMLIVSLIHFHRVNFFGYRCYIFNENNEEVRNYKCRRRGVLSGKDIIFSDNYKFNDFLKGDSISKLINIFILLDISKKEKFKKIVNDYLTISEIEIFEHKYLAAFFALEAISKLIVSPTEYIKQERLIELACNYVNIDLMDYKFETPINSSLKWLITEYRNELVHFNKTISFERNTISKEYFKLLNLVRKLIISYLDPKIKDFPYPENRYTI